MKFGAVAPAEAKGGIVVHSIRKGALVLRKGTVVGDAEIAVAIMGQITARLRQSPEKAQEKEKVQETVQETALEKAS